MIDPNFFPSIPLGYIPFLNQYLYPGRSLTDDPMINCYYSLRIEDISENILCASISAPEITWSMFTITQNNNPTPVYVPMVQSIGTLTLSKVVGIGQSIGKDVQSPRAESSYQVRDAFTNWVEMVGQSRSATSSKIVAPYRRSIDIYLYDAAGKVAARWRALGCIPVAYTPFTTLSGTSAIVTEEIKLQPESFDRVTNRG